MSNAVNNPIGFFDSGVGGLSLLRHAVAVLPSENYIYFGDNKNAPYGTKSEDEILRLTLEAVDFLLLQNIKALVLACNTATSAAAKHLRERLSIPVIGVEPALKPAYERRTDGQIIVLATNATLRQEKFHILMGKYGKDAVCVPGSGIVELIERGIFNGDEVDALLRSILGEHLKVKTDFIVLGCTHYSFIKDAISRLSGSGTQIIDGVEGTINHLRNTLAAKNLLNPDGTGSVKLTTSSENPETQKLMEMLMNTQL